MKRAIVAAVFLAVLSAPATLYGGAADEDRALTGYRDALLAHVAQLGAALPKMASSADAVADRLIGGGNLYVAGQMSFISEASGRAGGLMMLSALPRSAVFGPLDVLFISAGTGQDAAALAVCRRAKDAGAYIVLFSPAAPDLAALCNEQILCAGGNGGIAGSAPAASVLNIAGLWAYTGELVAACTRKGKTPVLFQSGGVPGGSERNAKYRLKEDPAKRRFHTDLSVPPQPEGRLGGLYLEALKRQLWGMRGATLDQVAVAAGMMAESVKAGGTVHVRPISHFAMYELNVGLPWVRAEKQEMPAAALGAAMKPGDVYFEIGYYAPTVPYIEAARAAGGKTILLLCHAPIAPLEGVQADLQIDSQWTYSDGEVWLPGYDVPILPTSGVMQAAFFQTAIAKTQSLQTK